jgi:hypothetical protein
MTVPDPLWVVFLLSIAKGQTHDIQDWRDLKRRFGVAATNEVDVARDFLCSGMQLHDPFPLNRHWICTTNKLVSQVNCELQQ